MGVIAIIAALLIEQWRPLGDRKSVNAALGAWAGWLEQSFNGGEPRHGTTAWLVAVLPAAAAAAVLHALFYALHPLLALAFNIGALLYRLAAFLAARWQGLGSFGRFAQQAFYVLDWPAVRLTAAAFAVVGDFEDAVYCWRTQAPSWPEPNAGIVLAAGAGAMGVRLGMPVQEVDGMHPRPELGISSRATLITISSSTQTTSARQTKPTAQSSAKANCWRRTK